MDDLTRFVDSILAASARLEYRERLCRDQAKIIRDLEAELAKRDAMIAEAVGVMIQAKVELERVPVTANSAALDNGRYYSFTGPSRDAEADAAAKAER